MEWISVKDRLPEKEGDYLVYTYVEDQYVCRFSNINYHKRKPVMEFRVNCECCYAEDDDFKSSDVTHWMPLPKPPPEKPE